MWNIFCKQRCHCHHRFAELLLSTAEAHFLHLRLQSSAVHARGCDLGPHSQHQLLDCNRLFKSEFLKSFQYLQQSGRNMDVVNLSLALSLLQPHERPEASHVEINLRNMGAETTQPRQPKLT